MQREERLSGLVDHILTEGSVRVEEVIERFGVSAATARRDLDSLAEQQLVIRTRGGAMASNTSGDVPLRYRAVRQSREKNAIAARVIDMVQPGSVIAFNGGTTTTLAAFEFGVRSSADARFGDSLTTVVTNAVNIANDMIVRPQLRIVVTGGVARARSYELIGPLSSLILPQINIDTLFLGVSAVDLEHGLFTHHEGEAAINAAFVAAARRTVVLADSTKFQATAFARICDVADVDALVTDDGATPETLDALRGLGVTPIIA